MLLEDNQKASTGSERSSSLPVQILGSRHIFSVFHPGYTSSHLFPALITGADFNRYGLS